MYYTSGEYSGWGINRIGCVNGWSLVAKLIKINEHYTADNTLYLTRHEWAYKILSFSKRNHI